MPHERLARFTLLPELKFVSMKELRKGALIEAEKVSEFEVCPRCATKASSIYDRRWISVKDEPIRGKYIHLRIRKRRFWCKPCRRPFTEPVPGIGKRQRTTARFRRALKWACDTFESLKKARKYMGCSTNTLYRLYYQQLELELKRRQYPWPASIGIDEHRYGKNPECRHPEFATVFVDHRNSRIYEAVKGRSALEVKEQIAHIPGRENVRLATIDLSVTYRRLVSEMFPNARIVADKFHVVRLLHPAINKRRKAITGDVRSNPIRRLLLCSGKSLDFFQRSAIWQWLEQFPELKEIYHAKEAIHGLYRVRGYNKAKKALQRMIDRFGYSKIPEIVTLRKTLMKWRTQILEYFRTGVTNGRTEAFNGKAKLIRKKGYGFRSFKNYRLRLLTACT